MKRIALFLFVATLIALTSCRSDHEKVDVLVNQSESVVTLSKRGFSNAAATPDVVLAPGESTTLRMFTEKDKTFNACPHDIAFLENYWLDYGDTSVPLLSVIDTIGWERTEEDMPGVRNNTRQVCMCTLR